MEVLKCTVCGKNILTIFLKRKNPVCGGKRSGRKYLLSECQKEMNRRYSRRYTAEGRRKIPKDKYEKAFYGEFSIADDNGAYVKRFNNYTRSTRQCLQCGRNFKSEGPHNRKCRRCKSKPEAAVDMPVEKIAKVTITGHRIYNARSDYLSIIKGV